MHQIILYYNFKRIDNPEEFCGDHRAKCKALGLLGRIYIGREGINGTLAGSTDDIEQYKRFLRSLPGFGDTEFRDDFADEMPFVKLMVKTRPEIVTLDVPIDVVDREGGKHLSPDEWKTALETEKDYVLLDVRNHYESAIGHFEGAITPDIENFFDFPQWLERSDLDKNKKVLMYCTGGIRCEKFSVFMKQKGFKDIYQLHGGIINYAQEVGDAHYKGKCFVFDDRIAVPVEKYQKEPISRCAITGVACDRYVNCAHLDCNRLFICSEEGARKWQGCCSEECLKQSHRRPFDPQKIYEPTRKQYMYFQM